MKQRAATQAEARALSHPLRLRILRACLHQAHTNKELAEALGADPSSTLYHVRTLVRTGFLVAEAARRGSRGAREIPYRATGKSWTLDVGSKQAVHLAAVDAYRAELVESRPEDVLVSTRLGLRLSPARLEAFRDRLRALTLEFADDDTPAGEPVSIYLGLHRREQTRSERLGSQPD